MIIKHKGMSFQSIKDKKPSHLKKVRLLLHDDSIDEAVAIDTGFEMEFRTLTHGLCFEDNVRGWWYV